MSAPFFLDLPLRSRPMAALMVAQFLSAFADNVFLIAAIAIMKNAGRPDMVPVLQVMFVAPYVLLAPFVGPFADSLPKGWVLMIGNGVKFVGAALLLGGASPLLAYGLAGAGAATYSPAKYGILTQFFRPDLLVRANGLIEGSTIVAILTGVFAGGYLADVSLPTAIVAVVVLYGVAALANLLIPRLPPEHRGGLGSVRALTSDFANAVSTLVRDPDARSSMVATSLFWGTGATLRMALFAWVPVALGIMDNATPSNLQGSVSIGIVFGALAAGTWVQLRTVDRSLIGGWLLAPLVLLLAWSTDMAIAVAVLLGIGAAGGFFVVPQNALLQERGHETVGAGRALAVQNMWENLAMLVFVGTYAAATRFGAPVVPAIAVFGLLLIPALALVTYLRLEIRRRATDR